MICRCQWRCSFNKQTLSLETNFRSVLQTNTPPRNSLPPHLNLSTRICSRRLSRPPTVDMEEKGVTRRSTQRREGTRNRPWTLQTRLQPCAMVHSTWHWLRPSSSRRCSDDCASPVAAGVQQARPRARGAAPMRAAAGDCAGEQTQRSGTPSRCVVVEDDDDDFFYLFLQKQNSCRCGLLSCSPSLPAMLISLCSGRRKET